MARQERRSARLVRHALRRVPTSVRGGSVLAAIAFLLIGLLSPIAAVAGDGAATTGRHVLEQAAEVYRNGAMDEAARLLDPLVADPGALDPDAALTARHLRGLVARRRGELELAAAMFRGILAERPDLTRVRLDLAHTLFLLEEDEGARHHFELVRSASGDPVVSQVINGFVREMDKRRRWSASAFVSLAPSSNINQGTSSDVITVAGLPFVIDDSSRAKSGIGLAAGGAIGLRHTLAPDIDLEVDLRGLARRYREDDFNYAKAAASIGPRIHFERGNAALILFAERHWSADEALSFAAGVRAEARVKLAPTLTSTTVANCFATRHDGDWQGIDLTDRDGHACSLDLVLDQALSSDSFARLTIGGEESWSEAPYREYGERMIGIGGYKELPFGITLFAEARARHRQYDLANSLTGTVREDRVLEGDIQVTKRDLEIFGAAPQLRLSVARRHSNIDIYDYTSHGVEVTFTRGF
ncbi:MAG: DUF560 domain-containing protein [Rhizobiales bacterium]|nr:DUF560 domain-containing protein [Hyphomicrobiales bacterium]